ncbi:poly-beta-hydroxyalkanoate depolymerase [Rickettsia prowazekii str. GvV257]|uniref:polyhydroxyalkanoate depolymerase n=1 Tax=Rickettsia prowazekii TaxID=782 RepID=UPI000256BE15|nr:polyhydroxyalkanoate depolymerase [Rickettsia prowazekii]AFE52271.1 poly-beta-hydroxyalkanoate depolymerase [Rickettsia prowazekii str. GvV257]AFE53673.1 poly-beta-hydroxyalkanoate depolymerase [Rickettsia prowazekii str. RpGvF24]
MMHCDLSTNYTYYILEWLRAQIAPMHLGIKILKELYEHEPLEDNGFARIIHAYLTLCERMTRKYTKPEFNILETIINDKTYNINEQVIFKKPFCELRHFQKIGFKKELPKLLIVAPMAGHHATLLRSTVHALLPYTDIYITDWTEANYVPLEAGHFDMDDYIDYLIEFINFMGQNIHTMAVCQPTVPLLVAISLMSENNSPNVPSSMILIGGPIDARKNPTVVNEFALSKSLEWFCEMLTMQVPPNYPGYGRKVYPGFLQLTGFISLNLLRHIDSHLELWQSLLNSDYQKADYIIKFYDEYLSGMDMPAEFYLQTIDEVFQQFSLARGKFISEKRPIDLKHITKCALLGIEGELDDIAAVGQTKAALKLCVNISESMKRYHLQNGVGHYGVFSGSKFKQFIVPLIKEFIYDFDKTNVQKLKLK